MNLTYDSFIPLLLQKLPELLPLYEEHMDDNFNELLPHVLFGDITRFVVSSYEEKKNLASLQRIFTLLDKAIQSKDNELRILISVSFLENLPQDKVCFPEIKRLLSPALQKELELY